MRKTTDNGRRLARSTHQFCPFGGTRARPRARNHFRSTLPPAQREWLPPLGSLAVAPAGFAPHPEVAAPAPAQPVRVAAPAIVHRLPLIDAFKGVACLFIVWHHLAFYGPMSDVAYPLAPGLLHWLADNARMAVQLFLVVGGFLTMRSLAPAGVARFEAPLALVGKRYGRLAMPYMAALAACMLAAAVVRPWLHDEVVPGAPHVLQLLANGLLLQDLVGQEALSAGVWYVAIDFQLFAATVALMAGLRLLSRRWPAAGRRASQVAVAAVTAGVILSLAFFNRHPALDSTALYFFGAYGLGMLACWGAASRRPMLWMAGIALLGGAALALDFRTRIAVAVVTALVLVWAQAGGGARWTTASALRWLDRPARLGRMSYSVFLIHFPVLLCTGALVHALWPASPAINALGMLAACGLSLLAGWMLFRHVESRGATPRRLALGLGALLCLGGLLP